MKYKLLCIAFVLFLVAPIFAEDAPTTKPYVIKPPDGFIKFEADGNKFICQKQDEKWVRSASSKSFPTTHPTTRPSTLFDNLTTRRNKIAAQMIADLPSINPSQVDALIDKDILPALKTMRDAKVDLVFFVTPPELIKDAMRRGWSDPSLRYNRVSENVEFVSNISLDKASPGESLVPLGFNASQEEGARTSALTQAVTNMKMQIEQTIAVRTLGMLNAKFFAFIDEKALADMPSREDQIWFREGLANVLSVKYLTAINDMPMQEVIGGLMQIPPGVNINPLDLDLINPLPLASYLPEYLPSVVDGRRRRATFAMWFVFSKAGDKLPSILSEVRKLQPADGKTLAETIKTAGGLDKDSINLVDLLHAAQR